MGKRYMLYRSMHRLIAVKKSMHRKVGVIILISDKIDFNKSITKNKTENLNYTINLKEFEFVIF